MIRLNLLVKTATIAVIAWWAWIAAYHISNYLANFKFGGQL